MQLLNISIRPILEFMMIPDVTPFLWLFLLFTAVALNLGFCYGGVNGTNTTASSSRCIHSEREALLEFKQQLTDPSKRLESWTVADADCCSWYGVRCNASTAHVLRLHLRSLSFHEFSGGYDSDATYAAYEKTLFGGNISSALVSLKKLRYLDLSGNDFRGVRIPQFLGSMRSLRYLNLSGAGFEGMIPHQLGNLSNLQHLDLRNSYDEYGAPYSNNHYVEDLQWISGLSSLKFLDMSAVNLSKAMNWEKQVLTTLPSLQELHFSNCQLPPPQRPLVNDIVNSSSSLSILDLSSNNFSQSSKILISWVSSLTTLNSLNLANNGFQGPIPDQLQNLSLVKEWYLSDNGFTSSIPTWLYSRTHLKVLDFAYNLLSSFQSPPPLTTLNLSSLSILDLTSNQFQDSIPIELQNMTSLRVLHLSRNHFNSYIPNWLYGFTHLESFHLGLNNLEGKIQDCIGNMTSLTSLDMAYNYELELEGGIPKSFQDFCVLRELSLSDVKLRQDINQVFQILSSNSHQCVSNKLELLSLARCQLFGNFNTTDEHLSQFQNLAYLYLPENSISGQIPVSIGELMSLRGLSLSLNKLNGTLPISLGRLKKLEGLGISQNSLEGDVSEAHFENLTSLQGFYAFGNQLKLRVGPNWIPPFNQLQYLALESWDIGPQFPTWLRSLKSLLDLDLSNCKISSFVPGWFWKLASRFNSLNLSNNQIQGVFPNNTVKLDLTLNLIGLDISNNSFSGSISNFLCHNIHKEKSMQILNLGKNLLSGEIPNCWMPWKFMMAIDLSNNKFHGSIPYSIGSLYLLESLQLRNNTLSGELPTSLKNCSNLVSIDIGENKLVGNISSYFTREALSNMLILIFRSNKFHGPIPKELCYATSLNILDLANNQFSGTIPRCINDISAMVTMNESTGILQVQVYVIVNLQHHMLTIHPKPSKPWRWQHPPNAGTNSHKPPLLYQTPSFFLPPKVANTLNENNGAQHQSRAAGRIKRLVLPNEGRTKLNSYPDREFYAYPRFVTHVDDAFISSLTNLYSEKLRPGMEILDLMSSWVSHLPKEVVYKKVVGHGLNAQELAKNPRLDYFFVKDLNQDQKLELESCSFDAVLCTVSVQYLQQPEKVFAEVFRVLRPGGVFIVSFSNRLFYEKAITAWRDGTAYSRVQLVVQYFQCVEGFIEPEVIRKIPASGSDQDEKPPLNWILRLFGLLSGSDPFYAVVAYKNFKPVYDE